MKTKTIAEGLLKDNDKGSPLNLLGVSSPANDNLLDEVLEGKVSSPGNASGLIGKKTRDFYDAASEAKSHKENFLGHPLKKEEPKAEEEKETEPEVKEEEPEKFEEAAKEEVKEESKEEELPDYYQTLNRRAELAEQRAEQAERNMQAYLQNLERRIPQPQPQQEPIPYEQFGFESPEQYALLGKTIMTRTQQTMLPMLQQLVHDKFSAAVAKVEAQNEHWKEYFPEQYVSNFFQQVSQNYPVDYLAKVNWTEELTNAYKVKNYDRIMKDLADSKTKVEVETKVKQDKKQDEKEQRKADLKLVPKASQKGTATAKEQDEDIFAREPSKKGFETITQSLKKQIYGR